MLCGGECEDDMYDKEFLIWIHQRLSAVHGENELVDYMHKLRCIITAIPADQLTPNDGRGGNGYEDLMKRLHGEPVAARC